MIVALSSTKNLSMISLIELRLLAIYEHTRFHHEEFLKANISSISLKSEIWADAQNVSLRNSFHHQFTVAT